MKTTIKKLSVLALTGLSLTAAAEVTFNPATTALVITDPQNDFLSPEGVTWGVVGKSVEENHTV